MTFSHEFSFFFFWTGILRFLLFTRLGLLEQELHRIWSYEQMDQWRFTFLDAMLCSYFLFRMLNQVSFNNIHANNTKFLMTGLQ